MECFFFENLSTRDSEVVLFGEEFKHFKALRIQKGERVCLVNGKGLAAFAYVFQITKSSYKVKILNFVEDLGEIDLKIDLALGILDNKERFEYAFEKAIELRISEFFPMITQHTQKESIDADRLLRKAIASIKQTFRSKIPQINSPLKLNDIIKNFKYYDKVFVLDRNGKNFELKEKLKSVLILVGPEGGFSDTELKALAKRKKVDIVKICEYPLRSETAVVGFLTLLHNYIETM